MWLPPVHQASAGRLVGGGWRSVRRDTRSVAGRRGCDGDHGRDGMNMVIVYDSVFGNTEQVARSMAKALEVEGDVRVVSAARRRRPKLLNRRPTCSWSVVPRAPRRQPQPRAVSRTPVPAKPRRRVRPPRSNALPDVAAVDGISGGGCSAGCGGRDVAWWRRRSRSSSSVRPATRWRQAPSRGGAPRERGAGAG